jgi:hypothetical protein
MIDQDTAPQDTEAVDKGLIATGSTIGRMFFFGRGFSRLPKIVR